MSFCHSLSWKRFIALSLLLLTSSFILPPISQTYAQTSSNPYLNPDTEANVPRNLHTLTQSALIEAVDAVSCLITGTELINKDQGCLGVAPQSGKIGYVPQSGGLLQLEGTMITMLYTPALSGHDYTQYLSSNFITNKKAYAATTGPGLGFQGITPLVGIWAAFRNIVYLLFVVFFILLGLGIMLRVKIDPKTETNIQNTLPRVIVTLLLITFSFAIAGFLIDMMYLVSYIVVGIMQTADPNSTNLAAGQYPATGINTKFVLDNMNKTPLGFTDELFHGQGGPLDTGIWGIVNAATGAVQSVIDATVRELVASNNFLAVLLGFFSPGCWAYGVGPITFLPNLQATNWGQAAGCTVGWLTYAFVWLALYIALIIALFRLWFTMLKAYVLILIDVCLAPFYIVFGLFPSLQTGFGSWIRGLIAHLALFPATLFMFLLAKAFIDKVNITNGDYFIPPFLGNIITPRVGDLHIGYLIGFAIIIVTPTMVEQLREKLGVKASPWAKTLGATVGAGAAISGAAFAGPLKEAFRPASYGKEEGLGRQLLLGKPAWADARRGSPAYKDLKWHQKVRGFVRRGAYAAGVPKAGSFSPESGGH